MSTTGNWRGPNIVKDGLVLYIDPSSPNSYYPKDNTIIKDISGYGKNGTLTNGPTYDSANGGNIVFDGTNDYISLNGGLVTNNSAFCISFWAKRFNIVTNATLYSEGTPASWPSNLFVLYYGTEINGGCRVWFGYPTISNPLTGTTNVVDGKWHNVVYNQTNTSDRKLYVDTVLDASNTTTITHAATNLYLGANNNQGTITQFGNNQLSNLITYNRALTTSEILQNFNATKSRFGL